jgi:hypothetical protein
MQIRQHQELRIVSGMNSDAALAGETLAGSLLQLKFAAEWRELWHKRLGVIQKKPTSGEHLELPNIKTPSKLHPYQNPSLQDRSKNVSTEHQRISAARVTYERIMYQAFSMEVMLQLKQAIACSIIDASAPRQILYRASSRTKFKLNPPDYLSEFMYWMNETDINSCTCRSFIVWCKWALMPLLLVLTFHCKRKKESDPCEKEKLGDKPCLGADVCCDCVADALVAYIGTVWA